VGNLYRIQGTLTAATYIKILNSQLIPSARRISKGKYLFMQDNDPKHTAKVTKAFFSRKDIKLLPWPAQSPDMNPIETLWDLMENKMKERRPSNLEELWELLQATWSSFTVEELNNLAHTFTDRCRDVIKCKGFPTKW
jgi:transposase